MSDVEGLRQMPSSHVIQDDDEGATPAEAVLFGHILGDNRISGIQGLEGML